MNPFAKGLKEVKIINAFVDVDDLMHIQYQIVGGTFYDQEIINLQEGHHDQSR